MPPTLSGPEFLVNTNTARGQRAPNVTGLADGRFVVTWVDHSNQNKDDSGEGIVFQIFNADGSRSGPETQANFYTRGTQTDPIIAALPDGGFVVVWTDYFDNPGDPEALTVRARIFNANGSPRSADFVVH